MDCKFFRQRMYEKTKLLKDVCTIGIVQHRDSFNIDDFVIMSCFCSKNYDCYYKQLVSKKRECEKLSNYNNFLIDKIKKDKIKL